MSNILNVIEQLRATTKRSEKEAILKQNDSSLLRRVLELAYNPFINFYQKKIPVYQAYEGGSGDDYEADLAVALVSLKDLSDRIVTGNAAKERLKVILEACYPENAKVIELVVLKDLKIGADAKTINKVFPNLIPTFSTSLCTDRNKVKGSIKYPCSAELKLDGVRCVVFVDSGNKKVTYLSRNGREFDLLGIPDRDFLFLAQGKDVVFDSELVFADKAGVLLPRKTSNGLANKALKGTLKAKAIDGARFALFDVIPIEDYTKGVYNVPQSKRRNTLEVMVAQMPSPFIGLVPSWTCFNDEQVKVLFEEVLAEGQEGLILKQTDAPWEAKRVKTMLKLKAELTCELRVVDYEVADERSKYAGKLGALVCEDATGKLKVNVGTGFSDEDREKLKPEDVIGKIVEVVYNEKITDKEGHLSLFLPRFVGFREDKDQPDNMAE